MKPGRRSTLRTSLAMLARPLATPLATPLVKRLAAPLAHPLAAPTAASLAASLAAAGCAWPRPITTPMQRRIDEWRPGRRADALIVFLPGAFDVPEDFERFGFVAELRRRALPADIIAVDAHAGYFRERIVVERLRDEVVMPARQDGYRSVWLVGISMGGLGALLYGSQFPGVDGLLAIAPFLGTPEAEPSGDSGAASSSSSSTSSSSSPPSASSPASSSPSSPSSSSSPGPLGWERRLRAFVRRYAVGHATARPKPRLLVGWGRDDRFADALEVVFGEHPEADRVRVPGGHAWSAWLPIWRRVLDTHGQEMVPT